jgi:hypothetical protein
MVSRGTETSGGFMGSGTSVAFLGTGISGGCMRSGTSVVLMGSGTSVGVGRKEPGHAVSPKTNREPNHESVFL